MDNLWLVLERLGIDSTISIETRSRDGVIWQKSVRTLVSLLNQCDIHERPTEVLRMLYQQKHFYAGLTEIGQNERRLSDYQNFTGSKQAGETANMCYPSMQRISPRAELQVPRQRPKHGRSPEARIIIVRP